MSKRPAKPSVKKKRAAEVPDISVLLRVRSEGGQTVAAHAEMIASKKAAVLGKHGQPMSVAARNRLNEQIARGVETFLFITTRVGWNGPYVTYRCRLQQVSDTLAPAKRALIPSYYRSSESQIRTWFEIRSMERLTREEMNKIVVVSSGREIMSVIGSTASLFYVKCGA